MPRLLPLLLAGAASALPEQQPSGLTAKVYQPTWESLDSRPTPAWWVRQKFSLFMHWGLYAVPSYCPVQASQHTCYAEHFWDTSHNNGSAQQRYMARNYGAKFEYQDFAPMFTCDNFEPTAWAKLFKASGAQGLTMTSKHHEGWTLWGNPRHANWNAVDTGPHRDLLQEVGDAVRAEGLRFGFYYSLMEWDRQYTNTTGTEHWTEADYVNRTMIPDLKDLVNRYHPDVLYTDGEWSYPSDHWQTKPFLAWLFNDSPVKDTIAVNDRWGNDCRGKHGGFYVCEYGGEVAGSCIADDPTHPWTSHEGMGKSFGYNRIDLYKEPAYFVGLLVQSVAFGGHLQLNVGPTADGRVPHPQSDILLAVGAWLEVNGEAIWNTTGYPFGIKLGCTTPPAANASAARLAGPAAAAGYTTVPRTKSTAPVLHQLTGATVAEAEANCTADAACQGFDYFVADDAGAPCGHQGAGGLGWVGCATTKAEVSAVAVDESNTLYAKPGVVPGKPAPPAVRQCYTEHTGTGAVYVTTDSWPKELVFPAGALHPTPTPRVSVLGVDAAPAAYVVSTRDGATVLTVPAVSTADLPAVGLSMNSFVFKVEGARFGLAR